MTNKQKMTKKKDDYMKTVEAVGGRLKGVGCEEQELGLM